LQRKERQERRERKGKAPTPVSLDGSDTAWREKSAPGITQNKKHFLLSDRNSINIGHGNSGNQFPRIGWKTMPERSGAKTLHFLLVALLAALLGPLLLVLLAKLDYQILSLYTPRAPHWSASFAGIFHSAEVVTFFLSIFVLLALSQDAIVTRWPLFRQRNVRSLLALLALAVGIGCVHFCMGILSPRNNSLSQVAVGGILIFGISLPFLFYTHLLRSLMLRTARFLYQISIYIGAILLIVVLQATLVMQLRSSDGEEIIFVILAAFVLCAFLSGGLAQLLLPCNPTAPPSENVPAIANEIPN
jgi:hypothetical protein